MVRTRSQPTVSFAETKSGSSPQQSQTNLGLLAQAHVKTLASDVNGSEGCLTCLRDTAQKYCYDSQTGAGLCCGMTDTDSIGCNQAENPQIICSTDKIITHSSMYEVCPHNADQCDTKMLAVNNEMHGAILDDSSQISTKTLLNKEDNGWFGAKPLFEGWSTRKTSANMVFDGTLVDTESLYVEDSDLNYKIANEVTKASLIDDSYWRALDINSENGMVCSY